MYKHIFLFVIVCLSLISIIFKVTYNNTYFSTSNERQIELLTKYMETKDFVKTSQFNLNQEGSFIAYVYHHPSCDGGWLIAPMVRNSEGVDLFERQAIYKDYNAGPVSYMLQGVVFVTFPDTQLWIAQKINNAKSILGFKTYRIATVFAFRSFGQCHTTLFSPTA